MKKPRRTWVVVGVIVVIFAVAWIGYAFANAGSGTSAPPAQPTKLGRMLDSGRLQGMLQQQQQMMEQMRVSVSPQMQQMMDADPMWQVMRNGEFTRMMEDQQQQIDRMLGRGAP